MSAIAVVVMVAVCGLVWGGFGVLVVLALRREGSRRTGGSR